ncbi:MAG: hypothetical protein GQ565_08080 [Candidatus Aegiribacteria sp.]|nr:hypothetical protein [Candidatus Aegiribacteria sp.]
MITKETSRLSAPGYALRSNAAGKARKTGKESTLKNTVSCVDNPGHFIEVYLMLSIPTELTNRRVILATLVLFLRRAIEVLNSI